MRLVRNKTNICSVQNFLKGNTDGRLPKDLMYSALAADSRSTGRTPALNSGLKMY